MSKIWSSLAAGIKPYVPGEQPKAAGLVKLNTNENPYPPSPKAMRAIAELKAEKLALYPDPESTALREALAQTHGVTPDEVFVGNGSDEVLGLCYPAYFEPEKPIRFADITYSFYPVFAALYGMTYEEILLNKDFSLPAERFWGAPGGVILANPNAPTGVEIPQSEIRGILENNSKAVIVDEAYVAFGAQSCVGLIHQYENLIIVGTLSKSHSLAGLRVGYAIADAGTLEALFRIKNSFNSYPLDALAQAAAREAVLDTAYLNSTREKIVATRERAKARFRELGFTATDSQTNFLFVRHETHTGAFVQQTLRDNDILVRRFGGGRIGDYLRVSIGTDEQMDRLFTVLVAAL